MRISDWSSDVCSSDLRTGFAVAIVHRLLGVHEDDLMHDYLLTNTAGKIEERIAQGAAHIRSRYGAEIHDDAIRALMSVNPIYLDAALATVDRKSTRLNSSH